MYEPVEVPNLPQVTGMDIRYEVHLISNGNHAMGWPEGTPFIPGALMDDYRTVDAAKAALEAYRAKPIEKYHYPYLPARIVQIISVATIIQEVK